MNLDNWLAYIEKHSAGKMTSNISDIAAIAKEFQLIPFPCLVVTIAGTNGKGSCTKYLESILCAAGYKVGAYTSPHLLRANERIRINGKDIDDASLCTAFTVLDKVAKTAEYTYFEIFTLAALFIFQQARLDVLLLEVGIGGRLDAVNIVNADIAVITTVAIDHVNYLGTDREQIGYEKAGIMRQNKPVVCGDLNPPFSVLTEAARIGAPLFCLGKDFNYCDNSDTATWQWKGSGRMLSNLPLPSLPLQNAATALMVIMLLQAKLAIDTKAISQGLESAYLPGRFQCLSSPIKIILDVAHNPEAASYLAKKLAKTPCLGRTIAVIGMLKDKDIMHTLQPMLEQVDAWYLASLDGVRGALASQLLVNFPADYVGKKTIYSYNSVTEAYDQAVADCSKTDRIIVFGSFLTVAGVLKRGSNSGSKT